MTISKNSITRHSNKAFQKSITFCRAGQKNIRLDSLKVDYSEEEIRVLLSGEKTHTPRKKRTPAVKKNSLLIDIQAKLDAGKGAGYERWAKKFNPKQMSKTLLYIDEHNLSFDELSAKADEASARFNELSAQIKGAEKRMAQIAVLKTHIINYSKTRGVFDGYKASRYSKKYLVEHETDIILHRAAKKRLTS